MKITSITLSPRHAWCDDQGINQKTGGSDKCLHKVQEVERYHDTAPNDAAPVLMAAVTVPFVGDGMAASTPF